MKNILYVSILSMFLPMSALTDSNQNNTLPTENIFLESENLSGTLVVRVGSPLYNFIRDMRRAMANIEGGPGWSDADRALFEVEKWDNVGPNTFLVIRGARIHKGELEFREGLQYYLYREGLGMIELFYEPLIHTAVVAVGRGFFQSGVDSLTAILSNESLKERFKSSALAIWDSARGPAFAFLDIFTQMGNADPVRSVKAAVRTPFSIADLGLVLFNKAFRIPFDVTQRAVYGAIHLFDDDEKDLQTKTDLLIKKIVENNSYESVLSTPTGQKYNFGDIIFDKHGTAFLRNQYPQYPSMKFEWKVFPKSDKNPFDVFIAQMQGSNYQWTLIGTVEGTFDIDIKGVVLDSKTVTLTDLFSASPEELEKLRKKAIGTFHFDD